MKILAKLILLSVTTVAVFAQAEMADWQAALEIAQSSGHHTVLPEEDAAGAVDGVLRSTFGFHTGEDENPFWQVDLGDRYALGQVALHIAHLPERAAGFGLLLSDDGYVWNEVYRHDDTSPTGASPGAPFIVHLEGVSGRFVRIQVPGIGHLHLDEVQVFAEDGDSNLALGKPATQSSVSPWSTRSIEISSEALSDLDYARRVLEPMLRDLGAMRSELEEELDVLLESNVSVDDPRWASLYTYAVTLHKRLQRARAGMERFDPEAMRLAMTDLASTYPEHFDNYQESLEVLSAFEAQLTDVEEGLADGSESALTEAEAILAFQRNVLLANPLLDFDHILLLQRGLPNVADGRTAMGPNIGLPANWQAGVALPRRDRWEDSLVVLSDLRGEPQLETMFTPDDRRTISEPVLDFDAERILFTMEGANEPSWRIHEISVDGTGLQQVTPDDGADVGHFDPCYLADGDILFTSSAGFLGLPCVFGGDPMVSMYRMDRDLGSIRQLTFEQDSNWSPTLMANGRVLYQRWEYSDLPHSNSRLLFHMNPDGTDQREYYGSGSYFPASFFYARPVPDHPRKVIGVATGHHGTHRSGRLLLLDPGRGRHEAQGVVQEIPGYGKTVEPIVRDRLVDGVWPQFLHPYPLSSKYHLVTAKPAPDALWGIYLVDIFDNMVLLKELEGQALLWPIPMQETPRPPLISERVALDQSEGHMLVTDVYEGDGLAGIPRGTVAALRIFEYYFSYRGTGGLTGSIGIDGPWDIKRLLGTAPVESDGSAYFSVPANTPISIQALDEQGQALQLMRSWTVVQPGENASCIGCHESQNQSPPVTVPAAMRREPSELQTTWEAPARGFSYVRDVQPVLDRHCVGCHDGSLEVTGQDIPYLKGDRRAMDWHSDISGSAHAHMLEDGEGFTESYAQLHRYLRRPGIESDLRMLSPMDFHFSTTELGQMLRKGHHGVQLDKESWERMVAWFDLNAPFHGNWGEILGGERTEAVQQMQARAHELRAQYVPQGSIVDYESFPELPLFDNTYVGPEYQERTVASPPELPGWPFDAETAVRMQARAAEAAGLADGPALSIDLGEGPDFPIAYLGHDDYRPAIEVGPLTLNLVLAPGGRFVMGSDEGHPDEYPQNVVEVEPFWIAQFEITNAQYRMFDPEHESRDESRHAYQFGRRGFYQDAPDQPVVRVSWEEAREFCAWLSEETGLDFDLPTEAQWEWAARAGADTPFYFGADDSDYSAYANLADRTLQTFVQDTSSGNYTRSDIVQNPNEYDDWIPRCDTYEDGGLVTVDVGQYRPNPWGIHDMHGNAAEWTRSAYLPYPYREDDGRNDTAQRDMERVARGGSWRDRPHQATASYRRPYQPYQRVFNVGFRVVAPADTTLLLTQEHVSNLK